jgi:hypothetical protein
MGGFGLFHCRKSVGIHVPLNQFRDKITQKKKVKVSRYTQWRRMGKRRHSSYSYLTSAARWGWVVSVTPRPRFTPGKRTPGTHWIGGWVGLRAGLNAGAGRKILCPCRGSNLDHPIVQPVIRHYTAWATAAHNKSKVYKIIRQSQFGLTPLYFSPPLPILQ